MTRRLILIRHAKSSWADAFADDHGRALNDRGRTSAEAMGGWLAQNDHVPDLILTSDATRTVETTALLRSGMHADVPVKEISTLYHAAPQTIIDIARVAQGDTVALVGHNPGIGMAAGLLVAETPDHDRFDDYPTTATTVIGFEDSDWCEPGKGRVLGFAVPREL